MKKKLITMILIVCMACSVASCGKPEETSQNNGQAEDNAVNPSETGDKEQEEKKQEEMNVTSNGAEWKYSARTLTCNKADEWVFYDITLPVLERITPVHQCNSIMLDNYSFLVVVNNWRSDNSPIIESPETMLEDVNQLLRDTFWTQFRDRRIIGHDEAFAPSIEVESSESTVINELSMCRYTGAVVFDNGETKYTLPFVGYAADLQEGEGAYAMWMIFDATAMYDKEPLEEGIVEEYALKVVELLKVETE